MQSASFEHEAACTPSVDSVASRSTPGAVACTAVGNVPQFRARPGDFGSEADAHRWQDLLTRFYDRVRLSPTSARPAWTRYAHLRVQERVAGIVEPNARVLDVGCGDGAMLSFLRPAVGVGVDLNRRMVREARLRYPGLRFHHMRGEDVHTLGDTFDYVVISQTLGEVYDLQALFRSVQRVCHARTRVVVVHYSRVWQPILKMVEALRLKTPAPEQNWVPLDEVIHLLQLSGFEAVRRTGFTVAPLYLPGISALLNRVVGNLPYVHSLGLNYVVVARPVAAELIESARPQSVSIVVPACNEAGHIESLLRRIPEVAPRQEIIFVEGGSTDDTWTAIQRATRAYEGPCTIRLLRQEGTGKGDAVRAGFAAAAGDALIILDADISVPPEEIRFFYDALVAGHGEFINGSRMVYLMSERAMRFLNLLGNKFFGWTFTYLLSQRFRDTLCGTKALMRRDYERIAANRAYFGDFDPFGDFDLLFGAARLNLKIIDMPVHYKARSYGETKISRFQHGWMLLRMSMVAARKLKFV